METDAQAASSALSRSAQNAPATCLEYRGAVTETSLCRDNARSLQYTRPSMAECDREWLSYPPSDRTGHQAQG
jgi:hypothetical protein